MEGDAGRDRGVTKQERAKLEELTRALEAADRDLAEATRTVADAQRVFYRARKARMDALAAKVAFAEKVLPPSPLRWEK
jgi:hypothetical protein